MACTGGYCRNPQCNTETDCSCYVATATPTPTLIAQATPAPTQEALPTAGSITETATIFWVGAIMTVLGVIGFFAL